MKLSRLQIIHGKGKSRLKHLVLHILQDDARVVAFYDAPPQLGGWGRTVVDIKASTHDSNGRTDQRTSGGP